MQGIIIHHAMGDLKNINDLGCGQGKPIKDQQKHDHGHPTSN
jgi:hypothetical protein